MRIDVHESFLSDHSDRLLGARDDFRFPPTLYSSHIYQVKSPFFAKNAVSLFSDFFKILSLNINNINSHKTEKVEKARKYLAKEKKKQIEQEKKRIEADRKTLARKRNIYEAWLAPDGQELTNQQVEELLSAKEAELDKQDEAEVRC